MTRQLTFLFLTTIFAAMSLSSCANSTADQPPAPADCEGIEEQESCRSKGCVFYGNAVWYSVPDSCDQGEERPACLAPEQLDQPTNNPVITLKPEGTTDPETAVRVGGQQPLQGWETCADDDGGACACAR